MKQIIVLAGMIVLGIAIYLILTGDVQRAISGVISNQVTNINNLP